jgi:hypothetical protein
MTDECLLFRFARFDLPPGNDSALSQLKFRVALILRWTSSQSVTEFIDGTEVRRTPKLSCNTARAHK